MVSPVFADERQKIILDLINRRGSIQIQELMDKFDISKMTVWRDLKKLDEQGLIKRVHGGAVKLDRVVSPEPAFNEKKVVAAQEKRVIAQHAAETYSKDGEVIALGAGSTIFAMIPFLQQKKLIILTNGFKVMELASKQLNNAEVIASGGFIRQPAFAFVGSDAIKFFSRYKVNSAFLSATSISLEDGIMDPHPLDAEVKAAIKKISERTILLMDSTKFRKTSLIRTFDLDEIDIFITDNKAPMEIIEEIRENGVKVDVVQVE
ncbi:MAG: DeoR/GlpR family DNA-binding transcription regulator [Promethearchaeia archaeon]